MEVGSRKFFELPASELASVIFCCSKKTFRECVNQLLFGLPTEHFCYIKNIQHGMPLFLFNSTDRKLHGIYEADGCGTENINPFAWTDGTITTKYSAQVCVRMRQPCLPLSEQVYKGAIQANYQEKNKKHFFFELNQVQTDALIFLFTRTPATINSPCMTSLAKPLSRAQRGDEDGWVKSKKTNASPCIPPSAQSSAVQSEKIAFTPEHWYDNQENIGYQTALENAVNKGCTSKDPVDKGAEPIVQESLDTRVNVFLSKFPSTEGLEALRMADMEHEVVMKLKEKGKQISGEVEAEAIKLREASDSGSLDSSGVSDCALVERERLTGQRCLQRQTMLREEHEQLKENSQAVDAPVAGVISKNLELSKMREDEIKLRHAMDEAMSQTELLRELDQLRKKNSTLEYTQVRMASELEELKSSLSRMSLRMKHLLECRGECALSCNI